VNGEGPFKNALRLVEACLDNHPAIEFFTRVVGSRPAWEFKLAHPVLTDKPVRLSLPKDFPANPPQLHVDPTLCLTLPHVEEDGRVCLSIVAQPGDYEDPCLPVYRVIAEFQQKLLEPALNSEWVQEQFHKERLSYWQRFCNMRHNKGRRRRVQPTSVTYVTLESFTTWKEGTIAAYVVKNAHKLRRQQQVVCMDPNEPHGFAQRHGWASGTLVRGYALFIELPHDFPWTPATWPQHFGDLAALVGGVTTQDNFLIDWLLESKRKFGIKPAADDDADPTTGLHPLMVVLVQDAVPYAYQIWPSTVPVITTPTVEPIKLVRIDAAWCLTRDHAPAVFNPRQKKRVLVFGCGSLGSPLIELLARAGVGTLDIVDSDLFNTPNTARHILGVKSVQCSKSIAMAVRLKAELPGVEVNGYFEQASTWVETKCRTGQYDLIVDCTAESSVRTLLTHWRETAFGNCSVIHAWVEPFCAAAHVVLSRTTEPWPKDDPADTLVNVADYSKADVRIDLPACGDGFHPYGATDIWQAAAFAAERVLAVVDDINYPSTIWSWVRSKAFFETLNADIKTGALVPTVGTRFDSVMITREYLKVLGNK
jgi:sulfur-carrier protein adenylyltransferase/sulfurtransferase